MINLIPPDEKRQMRAGRTNIVLTRYIIISLGTFLFLLVAIGFAYYILTSIKASADGLLANNQTKVDASTNASAQLQQFQVSLNKARTVFASDINYTTVFTRLGNIIPDGVVLSSFSISPTSFGTPTTLQAYAKNNAGITALQSKLQGSPYFSGVTLQSITTTSDSTYPVTATFALTVSQGITQ